MREESNMPDDNNRIGMPRLIVIVWILGLMWLLGHGRYQAFLRADLWPLLLAAMFGFVILLVALSTDAARDHGCGQCVKPKRLTRWLQAGMLLLPLWYAFTGATDYTLGADAFAQRWMHMDGEVLTSGESQSRTTPNAVDTKDAPARTVSLLDIALSDDELVGYRVTTVGQVYRGPEIPDGHFVIFRFVITCCAADAQPVGVLVAVTGQPLPEVESWVRVEGKLDLIVHGDRTQYVIRSTSVRSIPRPQPAYITARWQ